MMNSLLSEGVMQLRLLGTPQILWCGEPFTLSRRQARALLFYLAHTSNPVSRGRLAFLFWPDLPDATARTNLKRLLSTMRKALPDASLLSSGRGAVALDRERVWCDTAAFQQFVEASEPVLLTQAVDLYNGPFLDGFSLPDCPEFGDWQFQVQRQAERHHLAALSSLIDARAAGDDVESAIDYARRYLAVDDLAEDVHRRLMGLYAAIGNRTAAARQFERCTLILERELGVKPLPETRVAYEAAISAQPAPAPIAPTWSVLPSLDLPLIGREEAWQALSDAHRRLQSGGLILISGEPGIGKSRLMQEFATTSGSTVLTGNNPAGAQTIPYTAISEALRQALSLPERWQAIRPIWMAEVGRLLPEMAEKFADLPKPVDVEPAQAQARLFEALTRCFIGLATHGRLLLSLDDLQWADPATVSWLTALSRRLAGSNVCILATYRVTDAEVLADLKRAYSRPGHLAEIALSRLTARAIANILEQLPLPLGDPEPLATRIHHATGGNTFFVLETVRALLEVNRLADPPAELPLVPTVQAAIQRRLNNLSPLGRQVLETASVLEPDLDFDQLQRTAGRSDLAVAEGLEELVGRQLLADGGTHRFSHDLVRQVTYDGISSWRRRILHRRAAETLVAMRHHEGEPAWAVVAGHYDLAGDAVQAIRCYKQAALTTQRVYAYEEAIAYLQRGIELWSHTPEQNEQYASLQELLGDSLFACGQYEAAERAFSAALAQVPVDNVLLRATLQRKVAESYRSRHLVTEADEAYCEALETLGALLNTWPREWQQMWLEIQLSHMDLLYLMGDLDRLSQLASAIEPTLQAVGTSIHRTDYLQFRKSRQVASAAAIPNMNLLECPCP
ncbi:MAG: AAA family ATPase [Halieaceae bacterium]|nr:AAA family ATPase [Halieaceae bacterium]